MPRGVYPRKPRKQLPALFQEKGSLPLDVIPDGESPQRTITVRPKVSMEAPLIGLAHRLLDQQDKLMDMLQQNMPKKPGRKPTKGKKK